MIQKNSEKGNISILGVEHLESSQEAWTFSLTRSLNLFFFFGGGGAGDTNWLNGISQPSYLESFHPSVGSLDNDALHGDR